MFPFILGTAEVLEVPGAEPIWGGRGGGDWATRAERGRPKEPPSGRDESDAKCQGSRPPAGFMQGEAYQPPDRVFEFESQALRLMARVGVGESAIEI